LNIVKTHPDYFAILAVMTADVIIIVTGCFLLLIGLVGGGVSSKYLSVGKIDAGAIRVLCGVLGVVLIGVGISLKYIPTKISSEDKSPAKVAPPPTITSTVPPTAPRPATVDSKAKASESAPSTISVTIDVNMGEGLQFGYTRQSDDVELFLDDKRVVKTLVDEKHPHRVFHIKVNREGVAHYHLSAAQTFFKDQPPHERFVKQVSGDGVVDISNGTELRVENLYPGGVISLLD
jgi:hypothetical protein